MQLSGQFWHKLEELRYEPRLQTVQAEELESEHLAQFEEVLQAWQVWLILRLVLFINRAVPTGQVRQVPALEQLLGTH